MAKQLNIVRRFYDSKFSGGNYNNKPPDFRNLADCICYATVHGAMKRRQSMLHALDKREVYDNEPHILHEGIEAIQAVEQMLQDPDIKGTKEQAQIQYLYDSVSEDMFDFLSLLN